MTNNIEEPQPDNKKLWLILTIIAITVIGCTIGLLTFSSNSSSDPKDDTKTEKTVDEDPSNVSPPTIDSVSVESTEDELVFSLKVKDVDTSKWLVEYQIADQDRTVKDEGKERATDFDASIKLSSSAYYRIKVRATNEEGVTSDWSENFTVELSELEGFKTVEPDPAYFETGWAKGSDASLEGASTAIETAWNISAVSGPEEESYCLPVNTGDMAPTLLLPPVPSVVPKDVSLMYKINDWDGSTVSLTYLWCS